MGKLQAGVIGCGNRGGCHALGYHLSDRVDLVACCDLYRPAAERLAEECGSKKVYTDYHEMLENEQLDIVSMALWIRLHFDAVMACVNASRPPRLINAEKPMAPTFGEAAEMHRACEEAGIMLTFSHQRRFGPAFVKIKELLHEGVIGELQRMELNCANLLDWGTHWFDMMFFFNDDSPADWVMGQIDCAADQMVFGARVETAGLAYVKWQNGVTGLLTTGSGTGSTAPIRLIGSQGRIELRRHVPMVLREGENWEGAETEPAGVRGGDTSLHILDSIDCLLSGRKSLLCSENALRATELIFGTYESSRLRQRVCLPLAIDDSPLLTMIDDTRVVIPDWPAFLTEKEQNSGFDLLFNGHDLTGWASDPEDAWTVRGGILHGTDESPGLLRTTERYRDFSLALEIRLGCRGECSLLLRTDETGESGVLNIPLKDDFREPLSDESTGALRGIAAPAEHGRIHASRWAALNVTCKGSRVRITMGGETLLEQDISNLEQTKLPPPEGFIGLRPEAGKTDIRRVAVSCL